MVVSVGIGGLVGIAHRGQVAAAIHVADDIAAIHIDMGVALHPACRVAVDLFTFMFVCVDTATATIHVAVIGVVAGFEITIIMATDLSAMDVDVGVFQHMSVFARAEYRAFNPGFCA